MMLQKNANRGAGKLLAAAILLTAGFAGSAVIAQTKGAGKSSPSVAAVERTPLDADHLRRTYGQPVAGTVTQSFDGRIVLSKVDQMPQFKGDVYKWLLANVRAPEKDMQGRVEVQFTIDASGAVTMPFLKTSSGNPRLDAEAIRVTRSMPNWKPGLQNGTAVPVLYTLPFNFGSLGQGC